MIIPLKCDNCSEVIGETDTDFKLAKIQAHSCGKPECNEFLSIKAKELFDQYYKDRSFNHG